MFETIHMIFGIALIISGVAVLGMGIHSIILKVQLRRLFRQALEAESVEMEE